MKNMTVMMLLISALCACTSYQELKAPCSPLSCTNRIPVNTWPSE